MAARVLATDYHRNGVGDEYERLVARIKGGK